MIQEVEKSPKVALCRACYGTGKVKKVVEYPSRIFGKKRSETVEEVCRQCEGSGRVTVSAKMTLDIRPYKPKVEPSMNDYLYGKAARSQLSEACSRSKQDI